MKKQAKEPMTIEDLAGRMDGLFEQVDGRFGQLEIYIDRKIDQKIDEKIDTFAVIVARGFAESDRKIEAFKQETRENFQAVRQDIVSMNDKFPSNYIFDQLAQKVSLLEDQVNKKKR